MCSLSTLCCLHLQVYEQWDKSAIHGEQGAQILLCCNVARGVCLEPFQRAMTNEELDQAPATCTMGPPDDAGAPCLKPAYWSI